MFGYKADNLPFDKHCFCGSKGGVSEKQYASLNVNLKSLDDKSKVMQNINIVSQFVDLKAENIFIPYLVHGNKAVFVETPSLIEIKADACVTNKKNIALCVTTADCIPVLLYDEKNQVIGASHAGWSGALLGVVDNTIDLMIEKGAELDCINAAIGPCLQKQSFEVQEDFYIKFMAESSENEKYFTAKETGYWMDLQGYLIDKIKRKGINNLTFTNIDTYTSCDYFSFRRNVHQGFISDVRTDLPAQASIIRL
ncbi:MAG: peptidoglycan editing factor PgeF [Alphaproteobacteria bacterium]